MMKTLTALLLAGTMTVTAQNQLYPEHFPLSEVSLNDGIFKTAQEINVDLLMQYDVDRLLTPFVRQAGLSSTTDTTSPYYDWETLHPNFENWCWNPSFALDGHVGGHYLSALALAYAAESDATEKAALLERVNYMVDVLKDCQDAMSDNTEGLKGFIGGLPNNDIWTDMYTGDVSTYQTYAGWVPFYVMHKIFAGLRDAYLYAGSTEALTLFQGLCDWGIEVVAQIDADDMDSKILYDEHGGINEMFADAYALFGDTKYLTAAKKYSHQSMVTGMQTLDTSFLDYLHANTQVPKYLGFERIAEVDATATNYHTAALNFWKDVALNRTVCIGGNSVDEHFLAASGCSAYITNPNGPESCNTNNMMKLSETLFDVTHDAQYADFYETAMLNHILSTQDPSTGGYVYFTALRPQSYRIYSTVNEAMWCCVGTGMENHSKYAHFAYTHSADTLFVNLFVASTLTDDDFALTQETQFPYEEQTQLTIQKAGEYTLAVRHPAWATADYAITVNGEAVETSCTAGTASYVEISRTWAEGDVVTVSLPMELSINECPNYSDYVAIKYGPVLLAAATTSSATADDDYEELDNEYAGTGRMDHAPGSMATMKSLATAPMLICEREDVMGRITAIEDSALHFTIDVSHDGSLWDSLTLEPFYGIHNKRYVVYWLQQTAEEYANSDLATEEAEALALEKRTIDAVGTGEQQSEAGHLLATSGTSSTGTYSGEYYRDVCNGGYFEYTLSLEGSEDADTLSLMMRYTTADAGRTGYILIDGTQLCTVSIPSSVNGTTGFYNEEYYLPESLICNEDGTRKSEIVVRMQAPTSGYAPGVYYIRLLTGYEGTETVLSPYTFVCTDWTTGDTWRVAASAFSYDEEANTVTISATGANNVCLAMTSDAMEKYYTTADQTLLVVNGTDLSLTSTASYLWWLNGVNRGSSVAPTYTYTREDDSQLIVWDLTQSNLNDNMTAQTNSLSGSTIFGMTSTSGTAVLSTIDFMTPDDAAATYSELASLATGIQAVGTDAKQTTDAIYDMSGRRLSKPTHGLYIQGGQTYLSK